MYRVPEDDWSFFAGRRVVDGNAGPMAVYLEFDDGMGLSISINGGEEEEITDAKERVLQMMGRTVAAASRLDERRLELRFTDGSRLVVVDNSDQYESFVIDGPSTGGCIVV